ncbi:centrosomal protein of 95 kDa isoform X1 [Falco rusticolus]|uniref:centrosomal protein of 95 kDa isoform X1 n=1 Tax=Falco rusticolus TaxID=120794 RepID=UPI00188676A2|nr:centrosomal protein of 95 kDa isoform X1 [Falco rusticolus]XP_055583040.1 centrosomal protein of 95 kDa isoform X1 [Falco cherrug]
MGSAEERDWIDVANDLLRSCHINQHIKHLSECGADVFVRLYESILGEKVPDFIAAPRSQEDDAHNVQAVIDSLALDYLQVSLSHITGENIVKGERESIRNLLEIFDGLLEYLTEEVSESSSQNGDEANVLSNNEIQIASQEQPESNTDPLMQPSIFSSVEGSQSEFFVPSCDTDGSESTSELIRLGDTAHSFSKRKEEFQFPEFLPAEEDNGVQESKNSGAIAALPRHFSETERDIVKEKEDGSLESVHTTEPQKESLSASATKLGEPLQQAIPLLPPFQPLEARPYYPGWRNYHRSDSESAASANSQEGKTPTLEKSVKEKSEDVSGSLPLSRKILVAGAVQPVPSPNTYLFASAVGDEVVSNAAEDSVAKVPQVYETSTSASSLHQKFSRSAEQVSQTPRPESRYLPGKKSRYENSTMDSLEESLSHRRTKEKLSEQELHQVSEKLSHRLNELDLMLKQALGGHTREEDLTNEDNLSQHSDSVMDYRQRKAERDTSRLRHPSRPRSLSPSSPSSQHQLSLELEDKLCSNRTGQIKKIHSQLQKERDERTRKTKMVTKAYEDELRIYEARERLRLSKLREVTKKTEQEYKENIFKEPPKMPQPVKVYSRKTTPRNPKYSQWIPKRGTVKPKKAAPMKVRDDGLLFQLLEEFPHLHISHHTMNKMWQRQLAHTEQLKAASGRTRSHLQNEVQQALKKHELLVALIKKDQDHNKRLQEFKQRICRQKWAQSKVREKRQQVARARKYYEDYRVQLRAKMMRARTREERIFKNLFEEGLEIQKQRLMDLRSYAQEKRAEQRREHQNELESMENYYKDQFSMLAEALSQERQEIQTREKAQAQMLQKTKRELRSRMEKEIQQLQAAIMQSDDDTFFQELEADRLKSRLQMASFQYGKSSFL